MQDDSAIPHQWFSARNWTTTLYGTYSAPIAFFANCHQRSLAADYKANTVQPLPFGIGYRHRRNDSNLQIYRRSEAIAADDAAP